MTMITLLRKWLGPPTRPGTGGSRIGTSEPMTHGAKWRTQALDGWSSSQLHSSHDTSPMRAVEVEALVWSTMTGPPEEDLTPAGGDDRFGSIPEAVFARPNSPQMRRYMGRHLK